MSEEQDGTTQDAGPEDLGAPIVQLLDHVVPVAPSFRGRVSRAIERRVLVADATQFSVMAPLSALLELLRAVFEGLGLIDAEDEHSPTEADHSSTDDN